MNEINYSFIIQVLGKEVTIPKVPTPTSFPFDSPPPSQPTSPFHITGSYGKAMTDKVGMYNYIVKPCYLELS